MKTIHPSTLKALASLPAPKSPLKGRDHKRVAFPFNFNNRLAVQLWEAIPSCHRDILVERQRGNHFKPARIVSPEAWKKAGKVVSFLEEQAKAKLLASMEPAKSNPAPASHRQRNHESPVSVRLLALEESPLTKDEAAKLVELIDGNRHPFTGRALELKYKSGLTWRQIGA